MVWTVERLRPVIDSILNPGEEILHLYQSETTKSIYVCILFDDYYYKVFRISNHPSHSTYKQPTFYDFHGEFYIKGAIRNYLYQTGGWYDLSKQRYYLLRFFQKAWEEKVDIVASWHKGRLRVHFSVDEEDCQVYYRFPENQSREVERLLASGLLTSVHVSKSTIKIRISRFVVPYLDLVQERKLYRRKPSKSMLQWDKYQTQLIETDRVIRPVKEDKSGIFERVKQHLASYLFRPVIQYWQVVLKNIDWQERKPKVRVKKEVKLPDPIEAKWKKNIAKRHKGKMGQLIGNDALEKLQALKSELEE